ncbi:MAG: nucleotidyltransferase family protein [Promethearchaeota archaeon]
MKKSLDEIKEIIKKHKKTLKEKYHIKEIGIFGSFVRGEAKEDSDVDILVEFEKPIGFFKFLQLEEYLSDLIGKKVDLVSKKALKPHIGKYILEEVVII